MRGDDVSAPSQVWPKLGAKIVAHLRADVGSACREGARVQSASSTSDWTAQNFCDVGLGNLCGVPQLTANFGQLLTLRPLPRLCDKRATHPQRQARPAELSTALYRVFGRAPLIMIGERNLLGLRCGGPDCVHEGRSVVRGYVPG